MENQEETIDLKYLQSRINDIKKEGQESAEFTQQFIECLIARHDLEYSIPDDFEWEGVPEVVIEKLREGTPPTVEEITLMSGEVQNELLCELIWYCGMTAIGYYTKDEELDEGEDSTLVSILRMRDESDGHRIAVYLIAVLSLLMCQLPSEHMISIITNDFADDKEQMQKNIDLFLEWSSAVLTRYQEDIVYLGD